MYIYPLVNKKITGKVVNFNGVLIEWLGRGEVLGLNPI